MTSSTPTDRRPAGKRGLLPNDPEKPRLRLTLPHLAALGAVTPQLPISPLRLDDLTQVANNQLGFPMFLNDKYGCCVWSAAGHAVQVLTALGQHHEITVTDDVILTGYESTGFDPADPSTDRGTVIQDMLFYWRKTGIGGHTIAAFAEVPLHDRALVEAALNVFGVAVIGVNLPKSAEDQFATHQEWIPADGDGATILGGHCILAGAYQQLSSTDVVPQAVTWGAVQDISDAWWWEYVTEMWVVFTRDWTDAAGVSPRGIALAGLGQDFTALTGEPNPFKPAPITPEDALAAFLPAAQAWLHEAHVLHQNRAFAKSLMSYLHGIGVLPA